MASFCVYTVVSSIVMLWVILTISLKFALQGMICLPRYEYYCKMWMKYTVDIIIISLFHYCGSAYSRTGRPQWNYLRALRYFVKKESRLDYARIMLTYFELWVVIFWSPIDKKKFYFENLEYWRCHIHRWLISKLSYAIKKENLRHHSFL